MILNKVQDIRLSLDVTAVPQSPAGAGRYIIDLAEALAVRADVEMTLWSRRSDIDRWSVPDTPLSSADLMAKAPDSRPLRLLWEQTALNLLLARAKVDVHHGPHYTMPFRSKLPCVVTIHDLTFFDHPEWHERSKVQLFRKAIEYACKRAGALICVSEKTRGLLLEKFNPAGEVFVVPHGIDHDRFRLSTAKDDGLDSNVLESIGARPPYICFVGTLEPRKSVPTLVAAFDRLADKDPDLQLVLAGGRGWGAQAVDRSISAARNGNRVLQSGYVSDEVVPVLLRQASAVVYPALEEGFGMPALEALACGSPLVTTSGTVMAEMADGAAVLVEPGSVAQLRDGIEEAMSAGAAGEQRRAHGLKVASAHTWEVSAELHVAAYRCAIDGNDGGHVK